MNTFNESDHPRGGNPGNPGQFSAKTHKEAECSLDDYDPIAGLFKQIQAAHTLPHREARELHARLGADVMERYGSASDDERYKFLTQQGIPTERLSATDAEMINIWRSEQYGVSVWPLKDGIPARIGPEADLSEVVSDPDASGLELHHSALHGDDQVKIQVAQHGNTEPATLEMLSNTTNEGILTAVAQHDSTDSDTLAKLGDNPSESVTAAVCRHPNANDTTVSKTSLRRLQTLLDAEKRGVRFEVQVPSQRYGRKTKLTVYTPKGAVVYNPADQSTSGAPVGGGVSQKMDTPEFRETADRYLALWK